MICHFNHMILSSLILFQYQKWMTKQKLQYQQRHESKTIRSKIWIQFINDFHHFLVYSILFLLICDFVRSRCVSGFNQISVVVISQQAIIFWLVFVCVTHTQKFKLATIFFSPSFICRILFWLHRYGQWSVWYDGRIYLNGQRTFQLPLSNFKSK